MTEVCVHNLHMHTFLVDDRLQKVRTDPFQANSFFPPLGTGVAF